MTTEDDAGPWIARSDHQPGEGLSIMEAVAHVAGEPLSHQPWCASPVLGAWMLAWGDSLEDDRRQQLRRFLLPLANSRADASTEAARQWLVLDWVIRTLAPIWLDAAGLHQVGASLRLLPLIRTGQILAAVAPQAEVATAVARSSEAAAWTAVADEASAGGVLWNAVVEAALVAIENAYAMVVPASRAIGYADQAPTGVPPTWEAITTAVARSTGAVAFDALHRLIASPRWFWSGPADAPWHAAHAAARGALSPAERATHHAAHALVEELLGIAPPLPAW